MPRRPLAGISFPLHVTVLHFYFISLYQHHLTVAPKFQAIIIPKLIPQDIQHLFQGLTHRTLFLTQWNAVSEKDLCYLGKSYKKVDFFKVGAREWKIYIYI